MHDTLSSLVERALTENYRPLEFYLRENSRLPGPRANLELAQDVAYLLASAVPKHPENVRSLLNYFANGDHMMVSSNTPDEFVMMCGIIGYGACAAVKPSWRRETYELLDHYAGSSYWRVREAVAHAYQRLLSAVPDEVLKHLLELAQDGSYLQQRAAVAAIAEPIVLYNEEMARKALNLERLVLQRMREVPPENRKSEDFRVLRKTLGYALSVATAVAPQEGFALMRECADWHDSDITWILRENLKKKRLAKFVKDTAALTQMLA
jgi:hypothetical protein